MAKNRWTKSEIPYLINKTVLITGANSGLGLSSSIMLAGAGATVVMACRNPEKGEKAFREVKTQFPEADVHLMNMDLADLESVRKFSETFCKEFDHLHILLNNAGIMMHPYQTTRDGFESQIGINHLGHFALTGRLMDLIRATPGARVVNVSSLAHKQGKMDFENLIYKNGKDYSRVGAYARSKLANLLFTFSLQDFFERNGIEAISLAAHPGGSLTNLMTHLVPPWAIKILAPLAGFVIQSAEMGAMPQVRAAVDPNAKGGQFYGPDGAWQLKGSPVLVDPHPVAKNMDDAKKLWQLSLELTGVSYGETD